MKDNITLKKISESLGISISTVSRALKNHPDISAKTKQKVAELASVLEYEPNAYAIQLRTNNSHLFGLVVSTVSNYFYDSFIATLEEECRKKGYSLLILQSGDDPLTEADNLRICRQNRVSGVFACITPKTTDMEPFKKLNGMDIPVIFFDKVPEYGEFNKVCLADAYAAKLIAEIIIKKKRKNVLALFGNKALSITHRREESFDMEFEKNKNIKIFKDHIDSAEQARAVTHDYLTRTQKPDTICCMSDELLIGAMKAIQQLELKVPEDVAVISISNGFIPALYYPEISYVETSGSKLALLAYTQMMKYLKGDKMIVELMTESVYVKGGSI